MLIAFSNTVMAYSLHAYQSELYPTRIRARAVGFTYGWSRFSTIFIGFIIAFCLRNYGTIGVFVFIATSMVIVFLVIAIMGPRTTGLPAGGDLALSYRRAIDAMGRENRTCGTRFPVRSCRPVDRPRSGRDRL